MTLQYSLNSLNVNLTFESFFSFFFPQEHFSTDAQREKHLRRNYFMAAVFKLPYLETVPLQWYTIKIQDVQGEISFLEWIRIVLQW